MKAVITIIIVASLTAASRAQQPSQAPKPGLEHQRLSVWFGEWTYEGEYQATPLGPGGKFTGRMTGRSILNGFGSELVFVESGPSGETRTTEIDGYDPVARRYPYILVSSDGSLFQGSFTVSGNVATWEGTSIIGGKRVRDRGTDTVSPDGMSFTKQWEISEDGKTWVPSSMLKAARVKMALAGGGETEGDSNQREKQGSSRQKPIAAADAPAPAAQKTERVTNSGSDLIWGLKIPMRDGVQLNGTVYKPARQSTPLPVIFTLTPYVADSYHERGRYFSTNGYVFVLVDARGRGNSQGTFSPMLQEARDGYDVVEFLARQPWCDGQVAMWGGSYAGYDQWATAKEFPVHLKTIVPAAAAFAGVDFPPWKNIFYSYEIRWQTLTSSRTPNDKLFDDAAFWIEKYRELYLAHRSFRELDRIVGNTNTVWHAWLDHPTQDAHWDAYNPSDEQFARINLPILTITGHYDDDQPGAMEFYKRHMRFASPEAREKHHLLVGPWNHAGTRTPKTEFDGLKVGEASKLDLNALHKAWYDWAMKGGPRPEFLKKRVAYYVPGAEAWKYAESLEAITTNKLTFYLSSQGQADDAFGSGSLSPSGSGNSGPDKYIYDPLDVRPAELERLEITNSITDQRYALNLFGNGLVYHTEPLTEATEFTGYAKFIAWISLDVPDTDFAVTLYEILADGSSIRLTQDQMRARYRESLRAEKLITPGETNCYVFDGFCFFSRQVAEGSRLRLVVSCPNSIHLEKNYNSGGVVADESGKDARTAHVTLYHDAGHPSALELPVVR